jgi:hypothetical protein
MAKEDYYEQKDDEITFNILNQDVVDRLINDGDIVVPKKKIDVPKDKRWNKKQMTSKILQGIQNGDSIKQMSQAMTSVIGNNINSAIRNTRTMTTSAENHGRLDSYKNLSDQGVVMKKEWEATPDDRTRPSHVDIDGEEQDIDKPFSNGCMFPGDGRGPAEEVWMCRCAMGSHIIGFRQKDGSISYVNYDRDRTLHEEQMDAEKERRATRINGKSESNIIFDDKFNDKKWDEIRNLIETLNDEYNTRLKDVKGGAEKAAGDVDITGQTMRLNTVSISTALHEFAHTFANTDADKYGLTNDSEFWKEIKKIRREYIKDVKHDTTKWISSYEHSSKFVDEFMAEAFTHAKMKKMGFDIPNKYGKDFTYSQKVLAIIDKYFKRKK